MIRTLAALVALLGLSTVGTLGSPGPSMGLVVAGALVGALVILFGSCLLVGWIGARRGPDPSVPRAWTSDARAGAPSTRTFDREPASQRLAA